MYCLSRIGVHRDDPNPNFVKQFLVDYFFEESQELLLKVYDIDNDKELWNLEAQDFIGSCTMALSELITSRNGSLTKRLQLDGRDLPTGSLTLRAEEQEQTRDVVQMQLAASHIVLKNSWIFWKKPNTFVEVFMAQSLRQCIAVDSGLTVLCQMQRLREDGSWQSCFRTPLVSGGHPDFGQLNMTTQSLCNGDLQRPLRICIFHQHSRAAAELLGQCDSSLRCSYCSNLFYHELNNRIFYILTSAFSLPVNCWRRKVSVLISFIRNMTLMQRLSTSRNPYCISATRS